MPPAASATSRATGVSSPAGVLLGASSSKTPRATRPALGPGPLSLSPACRRGPPGVCPAGPGSRGAGARRSALRHSSDAVSVAPVSGRHDGGRRGRASARLVAAAAKRGKSPAGKRTRQSKPAEGRRRELNGLQAAVLSLDFNTRVALGIGVQVVCWLGLFYFATSGQ
mmetsp:Transcript_31047/g.79709  ORF Transcript_31047/g.79709 Transcript_31047/m.79709 type:complete len:168 (+) Transcript_31047:167-670(+)